MALGQLAGIVEDLKVNPPATGDLKMISTEQLGDDFPNSNPNFLQVAVEEQGQILENGQFF